MSAQLSPRVLGFLTHLDANNSKVWMDERRDFYKDAKQEFISFGQALVGELTKIEPDFADVDIKKCLFRINRDIRFSRNRAIYKPWFAVYLAPGGKKSTYAGLYLHIEPGGKSLVAGGCYELDQSNLKAVRAHLVKHYDQLEEIISRKQFKTRFRRLYGKRRTTLPRGYDKKTPGRDWLMQESRYTSAPYTDEQVTSPDFMSQILSDYRILKPLNDFFNQVIDRETPLERTRGP